MKVHFRKNSIGSRMLLIMGVVLLIQVGLFTGAIIGSGTLDRLRQNAFDLFSQQVITRKNYLEYDMVSRWTNLSQSENQVQARLSTVLEQHGATFSDIETNSPLSIELLDAVSGDLIELLRRNNVTGAFIVFNGSQVTDSEGAVQKSGLYFRDTDPNTATENNSDILIERAPSSVTKKLGIPMDSDWSSSFSFQQGDEKHTDFFYKPFDEAIRHPDASYQDLGYWSRPFALSDKSISVITYSVPLKTADGFVYGVLGVEITLDYLIKLMPYDELAEDKNASYLLAIGQEGSAEYYPVTSAGPLYTRLYNDGATVVAGANTYGDCYQLQDSGNFNDTTYVCIEPFKLYNNNTPFENDQWVLMGVMEEHHLLGFAQTVQTTFLISVAAAILLGALSILVTIQVTTKPIRSLVRQVHSSNPRLPVHFDRIHIQEFDELTSAIESLSYSVADTASKLSQIVEMASFPFGAFEYEFGSSEVFFTRNFFHILETEVEDADLQYLPAEEFDDRMRVLSGHYVENLSSDTVKYFKFDHSDGAPVWVRMKLVENARHFLGILEDVTQEIREKQKIEYERDYDLLTNLLNRRAFHNRMEQKFSRPEALKTAALIMMDLDNLKYINDTYGHDYGDQYIRSAARALQISAPKGAVLSRMSGDEFYVFLSGFDSEDDIRAVIDGIEDCIKNSTLTLPDHTLFRVRASAGVAWYPKDSRAYDQLIRYADFAMYSVKNQTKGQFAEFNISEYEKTSYLLHSKEELNHLIDEELLDYYFQPIVSAHTGKIIGYEALMRSRLSTLRSPLEILSLAKSQSLLYQIERLTWFLSLKSFSVQKEFPPDCKLFINSIASQELSKKDIKLLEQDYGDYLSRVVVELTEEERRNDSYTQTKLDLLLRWEGQLALDDFGTGYNNEATILTLHPQYIKVDMSIIRNVDVDENRQRLLKNILSYARQCGVQVIAEGVETPTEMETLIRIGVDFLQGYYLGVPSFTPQQGLPDPVLKEILKAQNK